jgi:hypothetical protein
VDAGIGVYVNILCAALMQLRGSRVIAHHHNYSYIAQPSGLVVIKVLIVVQPTKERELRCRWVW